MELAQDSPGTGREESGDSERSPEGVRLVGGLVSVGVRFPNDLVQRLKRAASETDRPMTQMVRVFVRRGLNDGSPVRLDSVPRIVSPPNGYTNVTLTFSSEMAERVREMAEANERTLAQMVRLLVRRGLDRYESTEII